MQLTKRTVMFSTVLPGIIIALILKAQNDLNHGFIYSHQSLIGLQLGTIVVMIQVLMVLNGVMLAFFAWTMTDRNLRLALIWVIMAAALFVFGVFQLFLVVLLPNSIDMVKVLTLMGVLCSLSILALTCTSLDKEPA